MKFELTEVNGFKAAFRGMRNPKNSHHLSDSHFGLINELSEYDYEVADDWTRFLFKDDTLDCSDDGFEKLSDQIDYWLIEQGQLRYEGDVMDVAFIGPKDMKLAQQLESGGSEHRKFLRQIQISVDITAPLYWWKEFDTYKVGTVANSCSTMHKIHAKEFTLEDFSHEHLISTMGETYEALDVLEEVITALNNNRDNYLETKDKIYWWQMIQLLPSSYNQKRTVQLNYEVLANMYKSRKNHKLDEWRDFCAWIEELPYAELITGAEEANNAD